VVEPSYQSPRRLRIAMVAPPWYELPPLGYGGLEVIVAALIDGLVERGHDVTLFGAGNRTGTRARFVSTTGQLQYPRLGELMPSVLHTARVNRLIADGDFDVVHDHTTDGPLSAPARRPPTLVTVHGDPNGEYGDYLAALGDAVGLVAISRTQRLSRTELNWVATVHNALADDAIEEASVTPDGPVLWLARFTADKGPDQAVRACQAAGLPLVLAGKCNEPEEQRYLDEEVRPVLDDSVQLITNPDRPETLRLLREARCLIMPIRWEEPFGMVMIEAMAVGTPVVGVGLGAVPELLENGVTGWIADDPEGLPELLRRVHELDAEACVAHVRRNFSASVMAQRYEQVYLDEIARHRPVSVPKAVPAPQKHRWKPGGPVRSTPGHPASHPPGFAPD
jgi:glycosyltransferase involved in cell wall biosynthesis